MTRDEAKSQTPAAPEAAPAADSAGGPAANRDLPPAAVRALEEAAARRAAAARAAKERPKELGGPKGEEPTRYGDWERSGRAVDF